MADVTWFVPSDRKTTPHKLVGKQECRASYMLCACNARFCRPTESVSICGISNETRDFLHRLVAPVMHQCSEIDSETGLAYQHTNRNILQLNVPTYRRNLPGNNVSMFWVSYNKCRNTFGDTS
ncbi:hypothetical protein CBL_08197 [Carabus blaptoides fortunei]